MLGQRVTLHVSLIAGAGFELGVDVAELKLRFGDSHDEISVTTAAPVDGVWRATASVSSSAAQLVTVRGSTCDTG